MILLDTPVLAALMGAAPDARLLAWFAAQPAADLFVSCLTEAELLTAAARQPDALRPRIIATIDEMMDADFAGRVLPFDSAAARDLAAVNTLCARAGDRIAPMAAQLAAIARANGFAIATLDPQTYRHCGVDVIDPRND